MPLGKYLIVLGGPTASGKTDLAIRLAQYFKTEILSGDSRQFYRQMNIGTAKPSEKELSAAPHHFIDHLDLEAEYSVGDYVREALLRLDTIFAKKDIAILVGGSGLYLRALCEGLDEFPEVSEAIKNALEKLYQQEGIEALQRELKESDPVYYEEVDRSNPHRLIRALGVCRASGQPFSSFRNKAKALRSFTPIYLQLFWPRQQLYDRINRRVDIMMEQGLLAEAKRLFPLREFNALKTVGYQELFDYIEGESSLETAVELIKRNSRRYAKRQLTWMRKRGHWKLFYSQDWTLMLEYIHLAIENGFRIEEQATPEKMLAFQLNGEAFLQVLIHVNGKKEYFIPRKWIPSKAEADRLSLHELALRCMDRGAILLAQTAWVPQLKQLGMRESDLKKGIGGKEISEELIPMISKNDL